MVKIEKERSIPVLTTARELWEELKRFPVAAFSSAAAYWSAASNQSLHASEFRIHIHGGTGAVPGFYHAWRNHFLTHIETSMPLPVFLPLQTVIHHMHLIEYMEMMRRFPQCREIHVGHSIGGFSCLNRLLEAPESVEHIILVGVPVHREHIHSWARDNVVNRVIGIDTNEPLPHHLERLRIILDRPDLLRKISVVTSRGDVFFPPEACHIVGAAYEEVPNCTHIGFIYEKRAISAIANIIQKIVRPAEGLEKALAYA